MNKVDLYREQLKHTKDWIAFLRQASGLPGPRGNLELAQAVAFEGSDSLFEELLAYTPERAPANTPEEFLALCGALGLGRLLVEGHLERLESLRNLASDPRWRLREAVAMALQRWGDADLPGLMAEMERWAEGSFYERRAATAALCEPRLLTKKSHVKKVLAILDRVTAELTQVEERRSEAFQALRRGLGYCWSVAVAAHPEAGKQVMEHWLSSPDQDVRWIMKENLKKARLKRMDAQWVKMGLARLNH